MAYSKIRQPKLSDVIEQQLEFLILEGTCAPVKNFRQNANWQNSSTFPVPLREAIQRLEAKGLLLRRQGGGTFVQSSLWQSFSDPLVELLSDHPESQFDLLETRHALEGIAAITPRCAALMKIACVSASCIRPLNGLSSPAI
jgi:GntR family transcriptional repressor for pyruvate dehydrogenase complex